MEKNRLWERKSEIVTTSSYTWVKPMYQLWRFVYIVSHVTLHAKAAAQKVNLSGLKMVGEVKAGNPLLLIIMLLESSCVIYIVVISTVESTPVTPTSN